MNKSPCKSCSRRYSGCHSNCKDYKEYRQALDERNELIYQNRERYYSAISVTVESRRRSIRRHKPNYKHKY